MLIKFVVPLFSDYSPRHTCAPVALRGKQRSDFEEATRNIFFSFLKDMSGRLSEILRLEARPRDGSTSASTVRL